MKPHPSRKLRRIGTLRRGVRPYTSIISERTLRMIDAALDHLRRGIVGAPIDPDLIERLSR